MEERSRSNWTMTDSAQEAFHELEDELAELRARIKELEKRARAVVDVHDWLYDPREKIACRCPYCKGGMRELRDALAGEEEIGG